MRKIGVIITLCVGVLIVVGAQTPLTPLFNLRGRTDSNGAVSASAAVAVGPYTPLTALANLRGRTDSSGNLLVTIAGGTEDPDTICLDAANQDTCLYRVSASLLRVATSSAGTTRGSLQVLGLDVGAGGITTSSVQSTGNYAIGPVPFVTVTTPTLTAGFGTSPSVVSSNGSAAFTINVGTGGTANTGTVTLGAASTGYAASCSDITNPASAVTVQTGGSSSTITLANYARTTGLLTAWAASDVIRCLATAY